MPSDESKNPLLQSFRRKLHLALQLTQDDFRREARCIYNIAFFQYASKARNEEAEKTRVLLVPDADDPERSKAIKGGDQKQRIEGALRYYRAALVARLRPRVHANFKPVAQVASLLIADGFAWDVEEVHGTTGWVISDVTGNQDLVKALHEYYGRPDLTMSFLLEFQDMFTEEWCRLVVQAELEAPSQPSTQTPTVHGDARSRALAGDSKNAAEEEESAEDRRRREVICTAVKLKLKGLAYCKFLDREEIHPSTRLQAKRCPDTYEAAYRVKKDGGRHKWRKPIQDEKTRFFRVLSTPATSSEPTVNETTKKPETVN